jgi:CheY-like chemotaxis protein
VNDGTSILLVEDNHDDVMLTRRALHKLDSTVQLVTVQNGMEAMSLFMGNGMFAKKDDVRKLLLILLDLNIPKLNGLVLLQFFRTEPRTKNVPIVIVSASKEQIDQLESKDLGAVGFVSKPMTTQKLAEIVEQHKPRQR